jgi:hypothetical protein
MRDAPTDKIRQKFSRWLDGALGTEDVCFAEEAFRTQLTELTTLYQYGMLEHDNFEEQRGKLTAERKLGAQQDNEGVASKRFMNWYYERGAKGLWDTRKEIQERTHLAKHLHSDHLNQCLVAGCNCPHRHIWDEQFRAADVVNNYCDSARSDKHEDSRRNAAAPLKKPLFELPNQPIKFKGMTRVELIKMKRKFDRGDSQKRLAAKQACLSHKTCWRSHDSVALVHYNEEYKNSEWLLEPMPPSHKDAANVKWDGTRVVGGPKFAIVKRKRGHRWRKMCTPTKSDVVNSVNTLTSENEGGSHERSCMTRHGGVCNCLQRLRFNIVARKDFLTKVDETERKRRLRERNRGSQQNWIVRNKQQFSGHARGSVGALSRSAHRTQRAVTPSRPAARRPQRLAGDATEESPRQRHRSHQTKLAPRCSRT